MQKMHLKALPIYFLTALFLSPAIAQQVSVSTPTASPDQSSNLTQAELASGDQAKEAIAKQLANPIANMISMPIQWEHNRGMGKNQGGSDQTLLLQPVAPFSLSGGDMFIARPIITGTRLVNVDGNSGYGISNVTIESFYAPYTGSSFIWGVGPYASSPSGNSGMFGSQQTGAGLTAVAVNRAGPWTYGLLGFQSWSVGGNPTYGTQNNLYGQPFFAYTTKTAWTLTGNVEATYNYDAHRTSSPLYVGFSKVEVIDTMPISFGAGPMYYLNSIPGGPQGWGARATITMVFLK